MKGFIFDRRLGDRIIVERRRKRLSQEELASLSEIDRTYLARIEEGKANPSIEVLTKIAKNLRINVSELLLGV